jgi:hypothetical protein
MDVIPAVANGVVGLAGSASALPKGTKIGSGAPFYSAKI